MLSLQVQFSKALLYSAVLISVACNSGANEPIVTGTGNDSSKKDTTTTVTPDATETPDDIKQKITSEVLALPEVLDLTLNIQKETHGERSAKVWIADEPKLPERKYYWVKVGEDNGTNLVTHMHFYVYPDNMRIMYYDVVEDKEISLEKWRESISK